MMENSPVIPDKAAAVSTGIRYLDALLGGLFIGDNVIWYDDAGSLAGAFCHNFLQSSLEQKKDVIYVSFDRSPKNLLDKLGSLAANDSLILIDCFSYGKGAGSDIFLKFYEDKATPWPCRIVCVEDPRNTHNVMEIFYNVHAELKGDVRFIFESLTGMQELWQGEDQILNFYAHSCPRLYELNTVAYWLIEKRAHSSRLRAQINQIAQVVIDLSVKRGKTALTLIKAEKRHLSSPNSPYDYWAKDMQISFEAEAHPVSRIDVGSRMKELRTRQGFSQSDLARQIGVTASTISQIEGNLIYPSIPALLKLAEVLGVEVGQLFQESEQLGRKIRFTAEDATEIRYPGFPQPLLQGKRLIPLNIDAAAVPYLIEFPPGFKLQSHFFAHKGQEFGYLLSGELHLTVNSTDYTFAPGEIIYLTTGTPDRWVNPTQETACLLWIIVK
jgi:transcriptional regulator with XRE-family HTH domain/KaiC/GvpD/RAD55 family RecA-like ATPase